MPLEGIVCVSAGSALADLVAGVVWIWTTHNARDGRARAEKGLRSIVLTALPKLNLLLKPLRLVHLLSRFCLLLLRSLLKVLHS